VLIRAALAAAVGWLSPVGAAAGPPADDCSRLWALSSAQADSAALRLADACAALPGLAASPRADALVRGAEIRSAQGDSIGAERALRSALELRPDDAEILIALARTLRDRPEEALPFARRAAAASAPTRRRAAARRLLGEIQADLGDAADAESSLARALELDGGDLDSLRAMVRLKRAEPAAAQAYARRAASAAEAAPAWCRGAAQRLAAQIMVDAGDPAGALERLERALTLDPDDIKTLRLMVQIRERAPEARAPAPGAASSAAPARAPEGEPGELEALRAGFESGLARRRPQEAAAFARRFTAAAATAPTWQRYDAYRLSVEMWLALGEADQVRSAMERLEDRDDQALETLRLWHRVYPESTRGPGEGEWIAIIVHLRRLLGDAAGAEAAVDRALARFPDDRGVLGVAADVALSRGEPERALVYGTRLLAAYEKASVADMLTVFPDHTYFAGRRISEKEKLQLALQDAGIVAQARRDRENGLRAALVTMARIKIALSDADGAAASLRRALALAPEDAEALRELTALELSRGRPKDARISAERLEKAVRTAPPRERAAAGRMTARAQLALSDADGAAASLRRALALAPEDAGTLRELIALELSRGRPKDALPYARLLETLARKGEPRARADAARTTARVELALSDADGAAASLRRALALAPEDAGALQGLIEVELARGRPEEARAYADRLIAALANAPAGERVEAYRRKAFVLRALKDPAGEEDGLRRALALAPEDAGALREMAELALARGRAKEARTYAERLERASERDGARTRADAGLLTAQVALALQDADGAAASLRRALALAPNDAEALRELSELELSRGRPKEALAYAQRLEKASATAAPRERADACRRTARIKTALSDASGAAASLRRALSFAPEDAGALRDLFDLELARGRPEEARACAQRLEKAARTGSPRERADAYRRAARAALALKDADGAAASLERALALAPEDAGALRERAELELSRGRPREALRYAERLEKASSAAPPRERADAGRLTAQVELALADSDGAAASLERALSFAPEDAGALRELFSLQLARGRAEEARACADRLIAAVKTAPAGERADAYRRQALARRELKDAAGAERSLRRALEESPEDVETVGLLLAALRDRPREALALVSAHRPSDAHRRAEWLALRGLARARDKDEAGARADLASAAGLDARAACYSPVFWPDRDRLDLVYFDACLERFPRDPALSLDRGVARFNAGRPDDALADFRKALELKPDYPEASLSLASALTARNRPAEALAALDKAVALAARPAGPVFDQLLALRASLRGSAAKP